MHSSLPELGFMHQKNWSVAPIVRRYWTKASAHPLSIAPSLKNPPHSPENKSSYISMAEAELSEACKSCLNCSVSLQGKYSELAEKAPMAYRISLQAVHRMAPRMICL